jgi:Predicted membrane protein (DUF2142)
MPKERTWRWERHRSGEQALALAGAVSLLVVGLAWSLASPLGASPDDEFHLATIWCEAGQRDLCRRTGEEIEPGVERVLVVPELGPGVACYAFRPEVSAGCQAVLEAGQGLVPGRANDGLYPGGFYAVMSLLASSHLGRSVVLMRMASWFVAMGLLAAALLLAGTELRRAFFLGAVTTLVPLGIFLFASNNPSGLAVAGVAAAWCAACSFLDGTDGGRRRVAAVAVLLAAALVAVGSRFDAGLFLAVALGAAWISCRGYAPALRRRSSLVLGLATAGALAALLGGQTRRAAGGLGEETGRSLGLVLFENALELPRLVLGSLGTFGLGWLDTPLPGTTSVLMLLAFGGAVLAGLGASSREKWFALGLVAGALVGFPAVVLAADRSLVGEHVQPRYVLPLLPVFAATALLPPLGRPCPSLGRGQVALLVAAVTLAHAAALHANIRRYVTGTDERGFDLGAGVEWWWGVGLGPMATWALGSAGFAVAATCIALAVAWGGESTPQARTASGAP